MSPSPPHNLSLSGILSETRSIVSAHSRHFLALSVIFLLPLSFLATVQPTVQSLLSATTRSSTALLRQPPSQPSTASFLFPLLSIFFSTFLSLCAIGSITYSVMNAFFNRPVKLASSLSSLLRSFLPLLLTSLTLMSIYFVICFIAVLVFAVALLSFHVLVSKVDYTSIYFILVSVLAVFALLICLLYFQVNWALAQVVVVVEKTCGLEPLKRSSKLVQGKKLVVLSYMLFFGLSSSFLTWLSSGKKQDFNDGSWKPMQFVIRTVLVTALRVMIIFCSLAAESVMYLYCKAVNGELTGEIAVEFGEVYVTLPITNDEKGI